MRADAQGWPLLLAAAALVLTAATALAEPGGTAPIAAAPSLEAVEASPIPPERRTTWQPGIPGGVPPRTKICTTIAAATYGDGITDATKAIQDALNSCPADQVVYLPPGMYRISTLFIRRPVVLRGAGPGSTTLQVEGNFGVMIGTWTNLGSPVRLASDAQKGSKMLVVENAAGIVAGDMLHLDQLDDPAVVQGKDCPYLKRGKEGAWRSIGQMVEVAARSGNTLTLTSPLHWTFTRALGAEVVPLREPATRNAGIEDLRLRDGGIIVQYAAYSWIRNVETERVPGVHVILAGAYRFVLRDSYAHRSREYAYGGGSYGYSLEWQASDNLIENNIVYYMNKPIQFRSSGGGNVVAYNYVDDSWSQPDARGKFWFQELSIDSHCSFPHMELVEGNFAPHMGVASTWGNAGFITYFRNHASSQFRTITTPYGNVEAIQLDARVLGMNVVGNVLGKPGLAGARYETSTAAMCADPVPFVYRMNYDSALGYCKFPDPWDSQAVDTLLRHGNFDYVTGRTVWDPQNPNRTLPSSLYLSEKPAFFGGAPWPWVDPIGSIKLRELPAMKRFEDLPRGAATPGAPKGRGR